MATEVKIPIPDQTTEEVRIVKWHKSAGDAVATGEIVLEVETDKSVIEVEAVADGVLLAQGPAVDDMVPVGVVVGFIGEKGEKVELPGGGGGSEAAAAPAEAATEAAAPAEAVELPEGTVEVKIPIPDQTTEEVRVVKWHANEGDAVEAGAIVLEVETDKSVIEVEAVASGVLLAQGAAVDDMVPVGQTVGAIGPAGTKVSLPSGGAAKAASAPAAKPAAKPAPAAAAPVAPVDGRIKASPVARKIAAKLGVDLSQVTGSGPKGRIVRDDVERFAQGGGAAAAPAAAVTVRAKMIDGRILASPNAKRLAAEMGVDLMQVAGSGAGGRIVGADVQQAAAAGRARPAAAGAAPVAAAPALSLAPADGQPALGERIELTKMRRAIAVNLQMSSRDTPHFNVTVAIDMTRAIKFRQQINVGADKSNKVSVNDLVLKACAVALRQYPMVNSRWEEEAIQVMPDVNVGIATALPQGLVVPVVTNVDQREWRDLAIEAKRVAGAAREGKIIGMGKGTFTVSNLGMLGVEQFTAIINPPEAAILAVGGTKDEVVAVDGMIGVKPIMRVTLCSDHRIIDGALAAQFCQAVKCYLEKQIA